jgi:hypothetical protein
MGHYAKVLDNQVLNVIVAEPEFFDTFVDTSPGQWIKCSYNTRGGIHYLPNSDTPSGQEAVRGNYPSPGWTYDPTNDVFYPPKPYTSWILNTETWLWNPPAPKPEDDKIHGWVWVWDEQSVSWVQDKPVGYPNDGKIYYWNPETKQFQEGVEQSTVPKPDPQPGIEYVWNGLTSSWDSLSV